MKIADGQLVDHEYLAKNGLIGKVKVTLDGVEQDLNRVESVLTGENGELKQAVCEINGGFYLDENGDIERDTKTGQIVVTVLDEATE